jgi:hypothetical protein
VDAHGLGPWLSNSPRPGIECSIATVYPAMVDYPSQLCRAAQIRIRRNGRNKRLLPVDETRTRWLDTVPEALRPLTSFFPLTPILPIQPCSRNLRQMRLLRVVQDRYVVLELVTAKKLSP